LSALIVIQIEKQNMKRIIFLVLLNMAFTKLVQAQQPQQSPMVQYANKVADRMKDSLQLTPDQRNKVYKLNIQLSIQKMQARQQSGNRDSVGRSLQRITNTQDSLYSVILNKEQFERYKIKKGQLLNNN
jgi:hypothetical protein